MKFNLLVQFFNPFVIHLKRQQVFKFILILTAYNLIVDCLTIPFFFLSKEIGITHKTPDGSTIIIFISWVVFGPLIETFIAQFIPILIIRKFTDKTWMILLISALIFSIPHGFGDISRISPSFLGGILFAFSFWHWLKISIKKAYWITCAVHSLHNIIVFILLQIAISTQVIPSIV